MPSRASYPPIETCIDSYVRAWDRFGDRPFDPDLLAEVDGSDPAAVEQELAVLAAAGLLGREDGRYVVRCRPDKRVEAWERALRPRLERLHGRVREALGDAAGAEVLERNGEAFVTVRTDGSIDRAELTTSIRDRLSDQTVDGVVVRAPAARSSEVQRAADDLCDPSAATETDLPAPLEKVAADVRGPEKDDLEYRLYLRATE